MRGISRLTLWEAVKKAESDERFSEELAYKQLEEIEKLDSLLNSFITVNKKAPREAKANAGKAPLHGIPIAVKDSITTKGLETTCGSKILKGYIPPYNATAVERLVSAGAVILGKTNMDEFSMGSSGENSAYGPTRNPWDTDRVPGGSSSGSAAAVAARLSLASLGADTGGSIRAPASFTATFGVKPTYGRVSRYGLIAYANSMEQIGPITLSVKDAALLLSIIAGWDPNDSTSSKKPVQDYLSSLERDISGWKIAVIKEMVGDGVSSEVQRVFWRTVDKLSGAGAEIDAVSVEHINYALAAYYIIACSEASSNLARYDGIRYGMPPVETGGDWRSVYAKTRGLGFGREVKIRIMLGTYALSAGYYEELYLKALKVRRLISESFYRLFKRYKVLLAPTMPLLPPRLGEKLEDPLAMYMMDLETVPASLAGLPASSVPAGFSNGLPVGVQVIGPPFREDLVLTVSRHVEDVSAAYKKLPPVHA